VSPRYPRPTRVVTRRWLVRYHKHGDLRARDRIIKEHLPFALFLTQKFSERGEPLDDLRQVASVGLIKAVDRFDINRDSDFFSYAKQYILGDLKHHFRDNGWVMHVTRGMQERSSPEFSVVSSSKLILTSSLRGRSPPLLLAPLRGSALRAPPCPGSAAP
jgi:DNA-directed RNA polymerase specialized sigma subunit